MLWGWVLLIFTSGPAYGNNPALAATAVVFGSQQTCEAAKHSAADALERLHRPAELLCVRQ